VPATGGLTIADIDSSDSPDFPDIGPTAGANGYGSFQMIGGTWTYVLDNGNATVQSLDVGESMVDTFTFVATDGSMQTVTITISGAEDNPTVDNPIPNQQAAEDVPFAFTIAADAFGDLDTSDTLTYVATLSNDSPLPVWLSFDGSTRSFSGIPGATDIGSIDIKVSADDGSSAVSDIFTLTVVDANVTPTIGGTSTGTLIEDADADGGVLSASGGMTISDPDAGESSFVAGTVNGSYGELTIDATGNWIYIADNDNAAIQALGGGQAAVDNLTVTTADGTTFDIVITILGTQDSSSSAGNAGGMGGNSRIDADDNSPPAPPSAGSDSITPIGGIFELPEIEVVESVPQTREPEAEPEPQEEQEILGMGLVEEDPEAVPEMAFLSLDDDDRSRQDSQPKQPRLPENQPANVDKLTLQVSDDETVNERFEQSLLHLLDRMHEGIDGDTYRSADDVRVQAIMGATLSLTAGIVSWVLRGGSLLASLMSTVPLLNRFDPFPILKNREDEEDVEPDDDEDETDVSGKVGEHNKRVDKMFSGKRDE
jgi:VCBS repeat-containing protein